MLSRDSTTSGVLLSVFMNQTLLLVLLTTFCFLCCYALYCLFSTAWTLDTWNDFTAANISPTQPTTSVRDISNDIRQRLVAGEHGFHNQRIAFENALVLAKLLNRTLLAPPVHLATKPIRYLQFDSLFQALALSGREGLEHCPGVPYYLSMPIECLHYFDSTNVPWNRLFDLSAIEERQTVLHLQDLSHLAAIHDSVFYGDRDVLVLRDEDPYHYQIRLGGNYSTATTSKYKQNIMVSDLQMYTAPLVQFGTLFGSHRLVLGNDNSLLDDIRKAMVLRHPTLAKAAKTITSTLGGGYVGIHLRLGDGKFVKLGERTAFRVWCDLVRHLDLTDGEIHAINEHNKFHFGGINGTVSCSPVRREQAHNSVPRPTFTHYARRCRHPHGPPGDFSLEIPLFVSTDVPKARSHPLLQPILRTFRCSFFLDDFPHAQNILGDLRNERDGVSLSSFFVPFLDAMVTGHAALFVGTPGSTFSSYVKNTLWPAYHS
ncbi:hypothetical protein FA15DRAFT_689637 [Coprinopsis marcescibilis]|uniref:CigA protein n=1 Tax=Coprinopsis marcescibilis TaxID=230819 RepID=A0A5C3KFW5_COPMA|nr:hypothetical protein FA15DRAFT_689637 [Coprinopsis marcescibilis]